MILSLVAIQLVTQRLKGVDANFLTIFFHRLFSWVQRLIVDSLNVSIDGSQILGKLSINFSAEICSIMRSISSIRSQDVLVHNSNCAIFVSLKSSY
jgi:hypothetical protein